MEASAVSGAPDERDAFNSFTSSFLVILVSESEHCDGIFEDEILGRSLTASLLPCLTVGDKTFLINCIMAMRNPRLVVFSGAMAALALMSVLSAALGYTLPALLSRNVTQWLAAALFLFFGFKMIKEAQAMSGDEVQHEMEEVTQQILDEEEAEKADKLGGTLVLDGARCRNPNGGPATGICSFV